MIREVELNLFVPSSELLVRLASGDRPLGVPAGPPRIRVLRETFFDTDDQVLRRRGMTCRLSEVAVVAPSNTAMVEMLQSASRPVVSMSTPTMGWTRFPLPTAPGWQSFGAISSRVTTSPRRSSASVAAVSRVSPWAMPAPRRR